MNTTARRGNVKPGDRSGVCRSRGVTTGGLQSGKRHSGQWTKRRCGNDRPEQSTKGPSNGQAGGGTPQTGSSGNKGSPTTRTGAGWSEAPDRSVQDGAKQQGDGPTTGASRGR